MSGTNEPKGTAMFTNLPRGGYIDYSRIEEVTEPIPITIEALREAGFSDSEIAEGCFKHYADRYRSHCNSYADRMIKEQVKREVAEGKRDPRTFRLL